MKNFRCILAIPILLVACTTTQTTSTWKAKDQTMGKYNKILVLGLIHESDRSLQQNMENHLVADLTEMGYQAISSLQEYGPRAFDKMDENSAIEMLRSSGVDAVVTIVLLDKEKERRYVAGSIYYSPYSYYYGSFWGYRVTLQRRIYESGYYVTDTKFFWESNLYDMSSQKLVYSVQTQSFDAVNTESVAHEYGRLIVKNMIKDNVLENKKDAQLRSF